MSPNPDLKNIRKSLFVPSLLSSEAGLYIVYNISCEVSAFGIQNGLLFECVIEPLADAETQAVQGERWNAEDSLHNDPSKMHDLDFR